MSGTEAKNLEAISIAIDHHNRTCPWPAAEVRMNPFEVERLGWDTIRGLPIVGDPEIGTGRFRIVCANELDGDELEVTEAIGVEADPAEVPLLPEEPVKVPVGPGVRPRSRSRGRGARGSSAPRY